MTAARLPPMAATVLILGGTSEGRDLAARLDARPGLRVVSSLAGRVRDPALPAGEVRIGGFGGADGLAAWLTDQNVSAVIDATHPFAEGISANAAAACGRTGTPLARVVRPPWLPGAGDTWHDARSLTGAAELLPGLGRRVFLTTGRQGLAAFAPLRQTWFLIRCVDPPAGPMPSRRQVILARGPYDAAAERALMVQHQIDVLVTKNSGGTLTAGKLAAARDLGIAVVMISRPELAAAPECCSCAADAENWLLRRLPRSGEA
jgi:precorrin-6A/cobalt-precorrin-6A reductase